MAKRDRVTCKNEGRHERASRKILLGFQTTSLQVYLVLLVNPAARFDAVPVLLGKVGCIIVDNMIMH